MDTLLAVIEYTGVAVFAVTGALVAARKGLDIVSFILLAVVTGIGGGTVRDMMLGRLPVFWVGEPAYLMDCVITGALMFFFARHAASSYQWILWGDAVGIALFTVTGARIALETGASWPVCVTMGVITSIVGGLIRDVLAGEPSLIIRKEIYATACAAGALVYLAAREVLPPAWPSMLGSITVFALRAAAISWRWQLPGYKWDDVHVHTERRRAGD